MDRYLKIYEARTLVEDFSDFRGGGNVITTLLNFALETDIIEQALTVNYSKDNPAMAIPYMAKSREEIISCSGSKYTFVSYKDHLGLLTEKTAVVGLPCQMKSIPGHCLKLGLFCGLNLSERFPKYIFKKLKIKEQEIESLDYRAPRQRGLIIKLKNGEVKHIPSYWWMAYFFSYRKCLYCTDYTNHFSDIAVGDRRPGWSAVITRTQKGDMLFQNAAKAGYLEFKEIDLNDFLSKTMTPMVQKEQKGGFCKKRYLRLLRGKWIEFLPINLLKKIGMKIANDLKKR